jgi:hypothetical protein
VSQLISDPQWVFITGSGQYEYLVVCEQAELEERNLNPKARKFHCNVATSRSEVERFRLVLPKKKKGKAKVPDCQNCHLYI